MIKRCPTCGRRAIRSTEANRRYWALLHAIAEEVKPEGNKYAAETWHEYFAQRFVGAEELKLPNGKTVIKRHSTSDLDTSEFNDYMTKVEVWAGERGVYLEMEA